MSLLTPISYSGKSILAPMVRVGTLPLRLLALRYGADLVFSPELISKKLAKTRRIENEILGTIDFMDERINGGLVLRVHPEERHALVVQIGSSDPTSALEAAKMVAKDVAGIDLNCGCPKKFSVHDGSGAGLLETPDLLISILTSLVEGLREETPLIGVTAKIRMVPASSIEESLVKTKALMMRIEGTGVKAITVHCRFPSEKPREPGHWEIFNELAKCIKIPLIANGDLWNLSDIQKLKATHGSEVSSFMFARGAQWNVSMFRKDEKSLLPIREIMNEYLKEGIKQDMMYNNVKYTLMQMKMEYGEKERIAFHKEIIACKSNEQLSKLFGIHEFFLKEASRLAQRRGELATSTNLSTTNLSTSSPPTSSHQEAAYDSPVKKRIKVD